MTPEYIVLFVLGALGLLSYFHNPKFHNKEFRQAQKSTEWMYWSVVETRRDGKFTIVKRVNVIDWEKFEACGPQLGITITEVTKI